MKKSAKKNFYISIAGIIGAGKTTISQVLAKQLGFKLFEEKVKENTFLPFYYKDPKRWALHSQIFYLKEKVSQLSKIKSILKTTSVIQDTPIFQDCFTYAKAQYILGYMDKNEHQLYMNLFNDYSRALPRPDLIIHLETTLPIIKSRIKKRGRDFEQAIDDSYLELLAELQKKWISDHERSINIIEIKTDDNDCDLLTPKYQDQLTEKIKSILDIRGINKTLFD